MKVRTKEEVKAIYAKAQDEMLELHYEMIDCAEYWIKKCEHLESEIARLERLSNG
jgi:hypothetical protein